jgi:hypothetical protein
MPTLSSVIYVILDSFGTVQLALLTVLLTYSLDVLPVLMERTLPLPLILVTLVQLLKYFRLELDLVSLLL